VASGRCEWHRVSVEERAVSGGVRRKEGMILKVQPYHSTNPSDPDVYHDHDSCPGGPSSTRRR